MIELVQANILLLVIALLIGLTALVVVGLTSFHVRQRTKQIGTRRALGARKADIIRQFLLENWVITTAGAVLGAVNMFLDISARKEAEIELATRFRQLESLAELGMLALAGEDLQTLFDRAARKLA